ncbi:LOG family protein [Candidatus Shapirobacteria bacterium]|nr:LOG family protein [Candidatus Shapirobacteria bacterium]
MEQISSQGKKVAIFGYSQAKKEDKLYQEAFEVCRILAQEGYTIVNGAGPGVMRAATEGAKAGGGKTIGVAFKSEGMSNFEGRDLENKVDELIITDNYLERTLKLLEIGDVFVIFNGGTGTISEFGMAWGLARLYYGTHEPLILYGSWWYEVMEVFGKNMKLRDEELRVYRIVDSPKEVLEEIKGLIG